MATRRDPNLLDGELARIIQPDSGGWGHDLEVGTVVRLESYDYSDNSWSVTVNPDEDGSYTSWVAQPDLGPNFDPVTDDEIADLFGLRN